MSSSELKIDPSASGDFIQEIMDRSGQNILGCYQCRRCAAGCPVGDETLVTPDRLIRMIVLGEKEEALKNLLVWRCLACYTCGTRCPNNIQTARITETLKQMSKEEHLEPLTPKVAAFHEAFTAAASHLGRINELEFMALYEMKNASRDIKGGNLKAVAAEMKEQAALGLTMVKKKRMHFGVEKVKGLSEVKALYRKTKGKQQKTGGK